MQVAIDFGTSYSAAARISEDHVELVKFGDDTQFRTSVFFPTKIPTVDEFEITDAIRRRIKAAAVTARREQVSELKRIEALRQEALKLTGEKRVGALQMVPTFHPMTDAEIERAATALIRREWLASQTERSLHEAVSLEAAVYGDQAIEQYVRGAVGHLVSSPKSMLGYHLIGQSRYVLTGVAADLLRYIKSTAERQFGEVASRALIGRPVRFRSSQGISGTEQALAILEDAAHAAGFQSVCFLEEPAAAFYAATKVMPATAGDVLVVDVGGGTTDLSSGTLDGVSKIPKMHQSWGLTKGGTDIDVGLSMSCFMKLFGMGQDRLPNHVFYSASVIQDLERQRSFRVYDCSRFGDPWARRIDALQRHGATIRLNRAVERTKIFLSDHDQAKVRLNYIERGLVASGSRSDLIDSCSRFLSDLKIEITGALAGSKEIQTVFLTGGSARAPYIIDAVKEAIGPRRLIKGDASYAVIRGLAFASQALGAST